MPFPPLNPTPMGNTVRLYPAAPVVVGTKPADLGNLGQTGNYRYCVCGMRKGHHGACGKRNGICRPLIDPNSRPADSYTQWRLPPQGHDFPRRYMDITPQEELFDPDTILGGPEFCYDRSTNGQTILQQPRLETTAYTEREGFDPSPYRVLEPLLEKLQHVYPRLDSETLYTAGVAEVPALPRPPFTPPVLVPVITFDTNPNVVTYINHIDTTVFDGLVPADIVVQMTVDGVPIKFVAQPLAATSPPTAGVQPQTPGAVNTVGMPVFQNNHVMIYDRARVVFFAGSILGVIGLFRKVSLSVWGWLTPFVTYGR